MTLPSSGNHQVLEEYQIFGDNILECERALNLLMRSLTDSRGEVAWLPSALYAPRYRITQDDEHSFDAQLFPGYGRWGYDVQDHLVELGSPLQEATDVVVVRAVGDKSSRTPRAPVLALEFCGALPAGNQAWQRCGRALACASAGVPYFYYAELGGAELDAERREKAPRLPNPVVPFGYLSLGQGTGVVSIPIFTSSPSISPRMAEAFAPYVGEVEALHAIKSLLRPGRDPQKALQSLQEKAIRTVCWLASKRERKDALQEKEWLELASKISGKDRASYLLQTRMPWVKKVKTEGLTRSLPKLISAAIDSGAVAIGSRDMPICLMGTRERGTFARSLGSLYGKRISEDFLRWIRESHCPLVVVWMRGFKPRGDDDRPDRGLVPLARMLFGREDVQYLTVIYGPATEGTWKQFPHCLDVLAQANGLWNAVTTLSDAILVDSPTARDLPTLGVLVHREPVEPSTDDARLSSLAAMPTPLGEQDVDTVLHAVFSRASEFGVFEAMCNPPGGDWSGMSFQSSPESDLLRWTSLPRVSGGNAKRPDHVAVFYGPPPRILSIESKGAAAAVESHIGPRLTRYVEQLLAVPPNVTLRQARPSEQSRRGGDSTPQLPVYAGVAYRYDKPRGYFKTSC